MNNERRMGNTAHAAQVVITRTNKNGSLSVLLIKRADTGVWTLPGGRPEKGESLEAAAIREAKEETGYSVQLNHKVGTYRLPHLTRLGEAVVFSASVVSGKPTPNAESSDVRWFNVQKLPYTLLPFQKQKIFDARNGLRDASVDLPTTKRDLFLHYLPTPWIIRRLRKFGARSTS